MRRTRWVLLATSVVLFVGAAVALAAPHSGKYSGKSTQKSAEPLSFKVTTNGKSVTDFSPTFLANCTKKSSANKSFAITTTGGAAASIKHGSFTGKFTGSIANSKDKTLATAKGTIAGKFSNAHSAKGTYSIHFTFNSKAGPLSGYKCVTGTVHWTARHA
jgi:hypothetical protein